jgi:hypothetical protein
MVRPCPSNTNDLHGSPRLPGCPAECFQEHFLADQAGARAGQEHSARRHCLQRQPIHVQITFQGEIDRFAVARLLGRVQHDDIELAPRWSSARYVAEPAEKVGLHEANLRPIYMRILAGKVERLLVEIDTDDLFRFP